MNFLNDIKNSFYNPAFYSALKERKLISSLGYFFCLVILLSFFISFIFGVELAPAFSVENLRKLADFYPKELAIQIKGGLVSTNVLEPYVIKSGVSFYASARNKRANFVVIDTKSDFSVETFKQYDTNVLIGKNFIVSTKRPGQFEFNDLSRMPDFSLNQARILHWIDLISGYHFLISLGLFVLLFLAFFGFFALKLIGLLIAALIILLLAKLKKVQLSYKHSYQIVLHAITASLILQTIFIITNISAPTPFFFSLILFVVALANIKRSEGILPPSSAP